MKFKIIRSATVPISLNILLKGQLSYLNQYYNIIGVSSDGDELQAVRDREGVEVIPIRIKRNISLIQDCKSLFYLYRLFRKEKPDIVHSITPKAGLLSMLAAKFAGVPIRMHLYTGLIFPSKTGFMQKLLIKMDQLLCWAATNVYPEGEGVKKDLLQYHITKKPLKILANGNVNGIDTHYFCRSHFPTENNEKLRQELAIGKSDFVFVFVGRLVKDKGINELVAAFRRIQSLKFNVQSCEAQDESEEATDTLQPANSLLSRGDDWKGASELRTQNSKLLLVGPMEQELDPLLPETIAEIESNKDIISAGWQNDVRPYLAIANALVFPSYREGFPNVVMQAGAMDLPSIVTDINGSNEIIIEGKNGMIIPPKDKQALFEAMSLFTKDKELVQRLSANAREMIVSRYEQKVVWNALLDEYKRLEMEKLNK